MIDRANGVIAEIATRRGLVYVDANSILKDESGCLAPQYCSSEDGIHLTAAAYNKIFENLKRYEKEIIREKP
jgi:lysophospholipase L1-like esterase